MSDLVPVPRTPHGEEGGTSIVVTTSSLQVVEEDPSVSDDTLVASPISYPPRTVHGHQQGPHRIHNTANFRSAAPTLTYVGNFGAAWLGSPGDTQQAEENMCMNFVVAKLKALWTRFARSAFL